MKYLNKYELFTEKVDFFEKGKFWTINGKKVKVTGSIPQNPQVLKFQEVDETGKPVGKPFVGKKGDVNGWKEPKKQQDKIDSINQDTKPENIRQEDNKPTEQTGGKPTETEENQTGEDTAQNPAIDKRYKELVATWKANQKKLGKNESPGEGTRARLMKQAQSEINFDETKDVDVDLKKLKKTTAYDAVDRLSSLVKGQKVKKPENVIKYLDFIKSKINSGNVAKPSLN